MGTGFGGIGEEVRGLRSKNRCYRIAMGMYVKYSIGNGVAKELIPMTCGHEQWCGIHLRDWRVLGEQVPRGKIWTTIIT